MNEHLDSRVVSVRLTILLHGPAALQEQEESNNSVRSFVLSFVSSVHGVELPAEGRFAEVIAGEKHSR